MGTPPLFRPSFDCVMGRRLLVAVLAALVAGQSVEVSVYFPLNPPFVMLDLDPESDGAGLGFGGLYGYDIELWSFVEAELANSLPRFRFVRRIATWEEMLNRTASSELAIGMSGVTITGPRAFSRDFSHPYFHSGLEFLIPQKDDVANLELVFSPPLLRSGSPYGPSSPSRGSSSGALSTPTSPASFPSTLSAGSTRASGSAGPS